MSYKFTILTPPVDIYEYRHYHFIMTKELCPICQSILFTDLIGDFICRNKADHSFMKRMKDDQNPLIFKITFKEYYEGIYGSQFIEINFVKGETKVWTKPNERFPIVIPYSFIPDFSDLTKLKSKIKTFFLFA